MRKGFLHDACRVLGGGIDDISCSWGAARSHLSPSKHRQPNILAQTTFLTPLQVVNSVVKPERLSRFDLILAGDDVKNKKPDPEIYNTARARLGLPANRCLVVEDSMVGLRAARGAGMHCVITPTSSTEDQPFCEEGAAAVVSQLAGKTYRVVSF